MNMMRVLVCGASSFVASGIKQRMEARGHKVTGFSRGSVGKKGDTVYGDYLHIDTNECLEEEYDVVINFAVIKDGTVETNLEYARSLVRLCVAKKVRKLIHFSSIMVYDYHLPTVDEETEIEQLATTDKKGYGAFKIAVDQYLQGIRDTLPFQLVFVRPGYVLADNRPCPFMKRLFGNLWVIKGNKKSRQPIVLREDIHTAILSILEKEDNLPVYLLFPNDKMTKYRYAKEKTHGVILCMPKWLFKTIPGILAKVGIMPRSLYSRFDGMYIASDFDSSKTETYLNIHFK